MSTFYEDKEQSLDDQTCVQVFTLKVSQHQPQTELFWITVWCILCWNRISTNIITMTGTQFHTGQAVLLYKSMSQYHKDFSCCKYKANHASPRGWQSFIVHWDKLLPSLFHPYSSGDPRSRLAMWEEIQILVCQAAPLTCCFRLSSEGGSFANTNSCLAASVGRNTFMFECASFSLPLGSYKLAMNLRAQTIEVFSSSPPRKTSSAKESTSFSEIVLYTEFFPIPKKTDVESHPVRAWIAGNT